MVSTPVQRPVAVGRGLHHSFILHPPAIDGDGDGVLDFDDNCDAAPNADRKRLEYQRHRRRLRRERTADCDVHV